MKETYDFIHYAFNAQNLAEKLAKMRDEDREKIEEEKRTFPIEEIVKNPGFFKDTHLFANEEGVYGFGCQLNLSLAQKFEFFSKCIRSQLLKPERFAELLTDKDLRDLPVEEKNKILDSSSGFLSSLVKKSGIPIQIMPAVASNLFNGTDPYRKLFFVRNCISQGILRIEEPEHKAALDALMADADEAVFIYNKNYKFPRVPDEQFEDSPTQETIQDLAERMRLQRANIGIRGNAPTPMEELSLNPAAAEGQSAASEGAAARGRKRSSSVNLLPNASMARPRLLPTAEESPHEMTGESPTATATTPKSAVTKLGGKTGKDSAPVGKGHD